MSTLKETAFCILHKYRRAKEGLIWKCAITQEEEEKAFDELVKECEDFRQKIEKEDMVITDRNTR